MKTLNSLAKSKNETISFLNEGQVLTAISEAINAVDDARRKCLIVGQMLLDAKEDLGHGGFESWFALNVTDVTMRTAQLWMHAARNVRLALPEIAFDVEARVTLGEILITEDGDLAGSAREWKQLWMEFTEDKTIKECISGVLVDGDEESRMDRAMNGKTKGGAGGDRKDYPLFVARKLSDMASHLSHWEAMEHGQRMEVMNSITAAILGDSLVLRDRGQKKPIQYVPWPEDLCEAVLEVIRKRLKTGKSGI